MLDRMMLFTLSTLSLLIQQIHSIAVEESSTGAILSFPDVSDGDLYNVTWEVEPAAFGYADYGGTLEAYLVLPANKSYHYECSEEPDDINKYIEYIQTFQGFDANWILVIDRGDCYFASKVYNAQRMGASGVIMLDYKQEGFVIMWEPDDFEHDVDIPSVMLKNDLSQILMKHLNVKDWNPKNMENTTYPTPMAFGNNSFTTTLAIIEWGLPHDDDRVEWELWTSSNDDRTMEFKRNFKPVAVTLDTVNDTTFTPRYYVLNGTHWSCTTWRHSNWACGNQCTNQGRYCAVDPEKDLDLGISGMDVVQEDLRQLCVWNFTTHGNPSIHNESVWWDYSVLWNDNCFNNTNNELLFNTACSYRQMAYLEEEKGVTGLRTYVNNCIETSGGYGWNDSVNTLLDYEVKYRESESIHVLPTFRVNEFMIYGEVDCDILTEDGCSVLDAICSGFIDGTEPDICHATPAPTPLNCSDHLRDCTGRCYGTYAYDRCDQCLDPSDNDWNACVGCNNVTHSGYELNPCGYCLSNTSSDFSTYGYDCADVCDGSSKYDRCGECLDPSDKDWNSCVGCDNVTNSGYETNPCGYCLDSTSSDFESYGTDCRGVGYCSDDTYGYDECGNCLWIGDSNWDSCVGCDGVAYSNASWHCGLCVVYGSSEWNLGCDTDSANGGSTDTADTEDSGSSNSSSSGSSMTISTVALIVGVVAVVIICIAGVIIYKLYKKQQDQSKAFENILKTYTLMDENPSQKGKNKSSDETQGRKTKKKERVPQNDDELEIEEDNQIV